MKADLPAAAGLRAGPLRPAARARRRRASPGSPSPPRRSSRGAASAASSWSSEGRARLRWVAVGARDGDPVEVRAGVEAGERVVLDPPASSTALR